MTSRFMRAVFVVAVMQVLAMAQGVWTQVATTGPSARSGHAMAYDSRRGQTVLFGGTDAAGVQGDTWTWDGSSWTQVSVTGPSARSGHAMVYDSQRGRIVLFGGSGNADTWEWDGAAWQPQLFAAGPTGRSYHAMAYDSQRGRTVLFGGTRGGASLADTWEWDGVSWSQVGGVGPSARAYHAMAYDARSRKTVLYGGYTPFMISVTEWFAPFNVYQFPSRDYRNDVWAWDGLNWATTALVGPGRGEHSMSYDSLRDRIVLLSGYYYTTSIFNSPLAQPPSASYTYYHLSDTQGAWGGGVTWHVLDNQGPVCRAHSMAFDDHRGLVVVFGGLDSSDSYVGTTWEWLGDPGTGSVFGSGCGSPQFTLAPASAAPPTLTTVAQASLANIPSTVAFVALGWSRTAFGPFALPISLSSYGMPGCDLLQSADAAALPVTFTGPGTATLSLPIPNWPVLIGAHVYLQGWAFAPGVNPGHTIVSNGLDWGIGY